MAKKYVVEWMIGETQHAEEFDDEAEAEHYFSNMQITASVFKDECEAEGVEAYAEVTMEEVEV